MYVDGRYKQTSGLFAEGTIGHAGHTGQSVFVDCNSGAEVVAGGHLSGGCGSSPTIHRYRFGLDMPFLAFSSTACGGAPSRREPEERGERVVCGQVWQGEPKNPECESVQDFYFLPFHSSLFTNSVCTDFLESNR